jgi:hypothetical protein
MRRLVVILVLVALGVAYAAGTFDRLLVNVGLQAHECARNGFGATFCGKELDEYRQRVNGIEQRLGVTK